MSPSNSKIINDFHALGISSACCHDILVGLCIEYVIPEFIIVILIHVEILSRCSCQIMKTLCGQSCFYLTVTAMHLRPCLFQNHDPQFVVMTFGEARLVIVDNKVVVDDDFV